MSGFITEHQRLKMVARLQAKAARQHQAYADTNAELEYWANLELPLEKPNKAAK